MDHQYDLFVYHDFTDTKNDQIEIGDDAGRILAASFAGLFVTALGPGIHEGRTTVVLSAERRPEMQQQLKTYFSQRAQ